MLPSPEGSLLGCVSCIPNLPSAVCRVDPISPTVSTAEIYGLVLSLLAFFSCSSSFSAKPSIPSTAVPRRIKELAQLTGMLEVAEVAEAVAVVARMWAGLWFAAAAARRQLVADPPSAPLPESRRRPCVPRTSATQLKQSCQQPASNRRACSESRAQLGGSCE